MPKTQELKWPETEDEQAKIMQLLQHYMHALEEMREGPKSVAYWYKPTKDKHAIVITDKGDCGEAILPPKWNGREARRGDAVLMVRGMIDAVYDDLSFSGDVATLEAITNGDRVEVSFRNERRIVWTSEELHKKIENGEVKLGAKLIIKDGPNIAFEALPEPEGLQRFRYLLNDPIPDVIVERDIGAPHPCLDKIVRFIRMEMTNPKLHRKYGIRSLLMYLLGGVSGSGKTLTILAVIRKFYEIVSEVTGVPMDDLPKRVMKMKASQMLSMWLGESDKNFDRFMDEAEELSNTPFEAKRKKFTLPAILILEEIDGLASQRGGHEQQTHDRILTTLLQRMDPTVIGNCPIVALATTNEPGNVDRAFLRRIGGEIAHFGMLCDKSFPKVLEKHVGRIPIENGDGRPQAALRKELVEKLTSMFFEGRYKPLVEVHLQGAGVVPKHSKDFLTAALVDRSVQQAARKAVALEEEGKCDGVSISMLVESFTEQIGSIVSQLNEANAHRYLDLPQGERVVKVKLARE